ncbi:MAG: MBG domain-containing protein [Gammaproteobacteria bacterium]|nr:MBG domain-containing protein [Gammaproteobacteria bacterium]
MDGTLSVNPAPLTITAHDHSRLYGASNPALTYTADGFVLGQDASVLDDFAVATAATESSDVGSYAIAADGSSSNYELTFVGGTLSVNPAPLTITAHDHSRLCGGRIRR